MSISGRRAIPWALGLVLAAILVGGFAGEAAADVYKGTITFQSVPSANITITVVPGVSAGYVVTFLGITIDSGGVAATVNGSTVTGTIFSNNFLPCNFSGTVNGPTATLNLDPASCGGPGLIVVTRVA